MADLSGRVAVVTGSGRGIGQCVAIELARRGAKVVTNDLSGCCAEDTLAEIRQNGGEGLAITADVSDAQQVEDMMKTVSISRSICQLSSACWNSCSKSVSWRSPLTTALAPC